MKGEETAGGHLLSIALGRFLFARANELNSSKTHSIKEVLSSSTDQQVVGPAISELIGITTDGGVSTTEPSAESRWAEELSEEMLAQVGHILLIAIERNPTLCEVAERNIEELNNISMSSDAFESGALLTVPNVAADFAAALFATLTSDVVAIAAVSSSDSSSSSGSSAFVEDGHEPDSEDDQVGPLLETGFTEAVAASSDSQESTVPASNFIVHNVAPELGVESETIPGAFLSTTVPDPISSLVAEIDASHIPPFIAAPIPTSRGNFASYVPSASSSSSDKDELQDLRSILKNKYQEAHKGNQGSSIADADAGPSAFSSSSSVEPVHHPSQPSHIDWGKCSLFGILPPVVVAIGWFAYKHLAGEVTSGNDAGDEVGQ